MREARIRPARRSLLIRRLVCIGVSVLLTFLIVSQLAARGRRDAHTLTLERMSLIRDALNKYAIDNGGQIPTTEQGLRGLTELSELSPQPRNWCGPYLPVPQVIFDGWGRKLHYVAPGGGGPPRPYDLWSCGRDDAEGGGGLDADLNSWEPETLSQ